MTAHTFSAADALPFIEGCGRVSAPDLLERFDIDIKQAQSAMHRLIVANKIHVIYRGGGSSWSVYEFGPDPRVKTTTTKGPVRPVPEWCGARDMAQFLGSIKQEVCNEV